MDAVIEAVLSEVDYIYSVKAEKRTTLKTFPYFRLSLAKVKVPSHQIQH